MRSTNRSRLSIAAAFLTTLVLSGSCGGGGGVFPGGGGGSTGGTGGPVGSIVPLDTAPRVDLPGIVSVFFRLFSPSGNPVADLDESHFQLFEDGNPVSAFESKLRLLPKPQVFRSYSHLLLDRSGSIVESDQGKEQEIAGARAYVEAVVTSPESYVKVSWFDGQANLHPLIDFTNDRAALFAAIDQLHAEPPLNASTNLYGAVVGGCNALDTADTSAAALGIDFRALTLVTFTDGRDTAGLVPLATAVARIETETGGIPKYNAYSIGLGEEIDQQALRDLGPQGFVFANDFEDLVPRFREVAERVADLANSFYYLSYCSPLQSSATPHTLTVRATNQGGSASRDYPFTAQYFGAGCGFLDVPFEGEGLPSGVQAAAAMAQDAAGNVLVVGSSLQSNQDLFVVRVKPEGVLDGTFGDQGRVVLPTQGPFLDVRGTAIAVAPGGAIFVGGTLGDPATQSTSQIAVWKLGANGAVQASFTTPPASLGVDALEDLALDSQGRIVACGSTTSPIGARKTAVWRLTSELALDAQWNGTGIFTHAVSSDPLLQVDAGRALAIDAQDRVVVAGIGLHPVLGTVDTKVIRVLATGSLDTTFGQSGVASNLVTFQFTRRGSAADVAIDASGAVVVGGRLEASPPFVAQPALWRFTSSGAPDTTFVGSPSGSFPATGLVTLRADLLDNALGHNFGLETAIQAIAVHTDRSIVASGYRFNGNGDADLALFRFRDNGFLHSDFNTVGFLVKDGTIADDCGEGGTDVLLHTDGRIWSTGNATAGPSTRAVVWIDSEPGDSLAPPAGG